MIHGYHLVLPHYGFWLPNDPRGSWSQFVHRWELALFGKSTFDNEQRKLDQLSQAEVLQREQTRQRLRYPAIQLTGVQALAVAQGFANMSAKGGYKVWACAILPEHTHLVVGRHRYKVEQMANLLKGAATRRLIERGLHPFTSHTRPEKRPPSMWAERCWKTYLDSEQAIENAINYVVENPIKEEKPSQSWNWLTPFSGVETNARYH